MPRYFFDIRNKFVSIDDDGVDLPDRAAILDELRKTLPAIMRDVDSDHEASQLRVDVRDDAGRAVVSATILMVIQSLDEDHGAPPHPTHIGGSG